MTWVLAALAAVCLIYYVIIIFYSGIATSFSVVWPMIAAGLALVAAGRVFYRHNRDKVPLWLPVSVVTVICTGILVFVIVEVMVFTGVASGDTPNLDYLIVLGARVREDGISKSLKQRLDKAIEYVEQNPETVLVLSGGQGDDEPVSEAAAMREYLVFNGVREEQMILETVSTSTVENIAYSRVAIETDQKWRKKEAAAKNDRIVVPGGYATVPDKPLLIGVLTSNFHVFRAKQIAKKWGIPDIYGISCDTDPVLFVHFCVRECAAILKDKLMGNM